MGIDIDKVSKRFQSFIALADVSLRLEEGEFTVLLGPSGSGKTTLLSIVGGFLAPDAGSVFIGGEDVTHLGPAARPTSTVFQDYALFPHMTLLDNVGFGLRMRGVDKARRRARAAEMLALVGLDGAGSKKPHELSGGQRQRVALARSLAVEPKVLLLDEPLGALDLKLRRQMQAELKRIQQEVGTSFVHVTHDQEEAMAIADRIVVMNKGRIEDDGEPSRVYLKPRTRFSADFMGRSSFLDARIVGSGQGGTSVETKGGMLRLACEDPHQAGEAVTLSIRPEHISIRPGPNTQSLGEARVETVTFLGAHVEAGMRLLADPDAGLVALLPQSSAARPGDRLELFVESGTPVILKG